MDRRIELPQVEDPMLAPRYREIATFMRAPLRSDPVGVDIAMIGVPFDGGVTNRSGARMKVAISRLSRHAHRDRHLPRDRDRNSARHGHRHCRQGRRPDRRRRGAGAHDLFYLGGRGVRGALPRTLKIVATDR